MLLENSTAVIVGGSGGLGLEIGRTFAREGASIVVLDRTTDICESAITTLKKDGIANVIGIQVDVSDP
jgi:NAD(P)-dependent dehydrogenase (short-subunit alcohol dehydrogenase family)